MHGAAKLSDCGIFLREAVPSLPCEAVEYPHRDDYYLFGVVYGGSCTVCVDFQEYELTGGDVVCVLPGQAHAFLQAENLSASLLGMDALLVGGSDRSVIDEYALAPVPCGWMSGSGTNSERSSRFCPTGTRRPAMRVRGRWCAVWPVRSPPL